MNVFRIASFVVFAALASSATAQTIGRTRAEVRAETKAAIRTGDVSGPGDSGKSLREQFPERYDPPKKRKKRVKAKKSVSAIAVQPEAQTDK